MKKILTLIMTTMMLIFGCNNNDSTPEISVEELHDQVEKGVEVYLLDVRTLEEFTDNRLEFADNLLPYDNLENIQDQLPTDKSTLIYCFCRSGRRSGIATDYLRSVGYENVYNVTGGIIAWTKAGYETASGPFTK